MRRKNILAFSVLFLSVVCFSPDVVAQCKAFAKNFCYPNLSPYIHDGGYQSAIMSEGEEAEVYKTIFAGQQYRLYICADQSLSGVEFVVSDIHRNILFDNRKHKNVLMWDFRSESSQQIKVTIRIPKAKKGDDVEQELAFGCVGILFGLKEK